MVFDGSAVQRTFAGDTVVRPVAGNSLDSPLSLLIVFAPGKEFDIR